MGKGLAHNTSPLRLHQWYCAENNHSWPWEIPLSTSDALTGAYQPAQIAKIAIQKLSLTTRRKKALGNPISRSTIYSILTNTYYYGEFTALGEIYQGAYQPMISRSEFKRVQVLIGNTKQATRPSKKSFTFTGLLFCEECGC